VNIIQFLRILWAWRWITLLAMGASVVGAILVVLVVPARWEAHSRIMLDTIKPDPLTGQVIGGNASAYAATQVELIRDYSVAGKAVDDLGWRSNPVLVAAYRHRSKKDTSDFRRWLAQAVIDRTDAGLVPGTNILDITFTAPEPREATAVAEALTRAFVQTSVQFRRQQASHNADWFEAQAEKARADLDAAATTEADYQRQTGIILQDDKTDIENARLRALASEAAAGAPVFAPITATGSAAGAELAQVDASIAQESQTLGPNHPQLLALKAKREALASQIAKEAAAARGASSAAASNIGALDRAMATAKSKVLSQSTELEHLRDLHAEVALRQDQYNKTAARAAELRQEAMIGDTGLTVMGPAAVPQKPKFPNKTLMLGGSLGLGLVSGVLIGLILELLGRRVRSVEDLRSTGVPVLAVIPAAKSAGAPLKGLSWTPRRLLQTKVAA
jgi:polysaccharide biosynthesis transport protein